jgi:hypothetical protein
MRPAYSILIRVLLLTPVSFTHWTCQPVADPQPTSAEYFPLTPGQAAHFDVTEQQYALGAAPRTVVYQIKEVVGSPFQDALGQTTYRLLRYRRATDAQPWQPDSAWSSRRTDLLALRTENGNPFVKLSFPLQNGATWNGNQYNSLGADGYECRNVGQPFTVQAKTYDQTATVLQQSDSTLVSLDKRVEVYAKAVGLVYRENAQLQYCSSTPACVGKYQIDYGSRQIYRLRSYGPDK